MAGRKNIETEWVKVAKRRLEELRQVDVNAVSGDEVAAKVILKMLMRGEKEIKDGKGYELEEVLRESDRILRMARKKSK